MNGKIMPLAKAALPITDIAVARGYAVFDAMLAVGDNVFHGMAHIDRFFASAKAARISIRYSKAEVYASIQALLRKNNLPRAKVRVIATGGNVVNGLEFDNESASLLIIAEPFTELSDAVYEKGVNLMTAEYQRPLAHAKTTNYMLAVNLQEERRKRKAFEILYTFKGNVFECSTSNFFLVKGNKLITADKGILRGIIRAFVLDSAKKVGLTVVERPITMKDVRSADEAFISASYKGVVPVVKVDDIMIGNGKVGHAAVSLHELYLASHA